MLSLGKRISGGVDPVLRRAWLLGKVDLEGRVNLKLRLIEHREQLVGLALRRFGGFDQRVGHRRNLPGALVGDHFSPATRFLQVDSGLGLGVVDDPRRRLFGGLDDHLDSRGRSAYRVLQSRVKGRLNSPGTSRIFRCKAPFHRNFPALHPPHFPHQETINRHLSGATQPAQPLIATIHFDRWSRNDRRFGRRGLGFGVICDADPRPLTHPHSHSGQLSDTKPFGPRHRCQGGFDRAELTHDLLVATGDGRRTLREVTMELLKAHVALAGLARDTSVGVRRDLPNLVIDPARDRLHRNLGLKKNSLNPVRKRGRGTDVARDMHSGHCSGAVGRNRRTRALP
jgi:hypothetical protein